MPKQIPEETKQRAVRLVLDHLDEYPNLTTACETVSKRLGFGQSRCVAGCDKRKSMVATGKGCPRASRSGCGGSSGRTASCARQTRSCGTAGVPTIKLHNVRHSIAFWLHQLWVAPADAAALLGHTVEVHLSTYLPHSGAAGIRAAARALGAGMQQQKVASES